MGRKRNYTDEDFIEAVKESLSVAQVLSKLGLRPTGGNYKIFHTRVSSLNLDTSHFTGQGHLKGKTHCWTKKDLSEIMVENSNYQSNKLRKRLLEEGIKEHRCENCGNTEWLGEPISLELDHINGKNTDNRLENLRVICPNCHAQTPTYRGKNKQAGIVQLVETTDREDRKE